MSSVTSPILASELAARPYRKVIRGNDLDGYLAEAPELPGCITAGETVSEASELLDDAIHGWITCALAAGEQVPAPEALQLSA